MNDLIEDRRVSNVIAAISIAVAATAITIVVVLSLLELKPWRSGHVVSAQTDDKYRYCTTEYFLGSLPCTEVGWWNPRYTHDMEGSRRAWEDRWALGNHTYRTKDLMGQRI
jgi:hypothetical protein